MPTGQFASFIPPGHDLTSGPEYRHFAQMEREDIIGRWSSNDGERIIREIREAGFSRHAIEAQVGCFSGKLDLRGIPLVREVLRQKDLSDCDLFAADLRGADLWNSDLRGSYLSEADLRGADLSWIRVRETLVDNVTIDRGTRLLGIDLSGINTNFALHLISEIRDQQRIDDLMRRHRSFAYFLWITSDYGRSILRWSLWTTGIIVAFSLIFYSFPELTQGSKGFLDGLYFSFVTFTTLGYGDIVPVTGIGKIVAIFEVTLGYLMGGILVAIITRRVLG